MVMLLGEHERGGEKEEGKENGSHRKGSVAQKGVPYPFSRRIVTARLKIRSLG
jgi:hypothetical protein